MKTRTVSKILCTHCNDVCSEEEIHLKDKVFCCNGCLQVYTLLVENGMQSYYTLDENPGISMRTARKNEYDVLDDPATVARLVSFSEGGTTRITISLPAIHCSSCIYLLENIHQLLEGITSSRVNFLKKEATLIFGNNVVSLKEIFILLDKIGYSPRITLGNIDGSEERRFQNKGLWYKLGLTGFSFGNIMLLSFPEYLGFDKASLNFYVGYINIALSIPILLYSAQDYFKSAWTSLSYKKLNIDVPVALGILTLFIKSTYDILSGNGEGYLDSFAGFVFFLLIGKWFQEYTHQSLSFERSYASYFPISTKVFRNKQWISAPVDSIQIGESILVRNGELIPTDGVVTSGNGRIDYSFVTGESNLIRKNTGDKVYAGGKQNGASIEVKVIKKVEQSYITQLWNDEAFAPSKRSHTDSMINTISKYFTLTILCIAFVTLVYWFPIDRRIALDAFTSVLIVACPCALALAVPFTFGNILRLLTKQQFYIKNAETIEQMQDIDHVVFDKTGTITDARSIEVQYHGKELTDRMKTLIKSGCTHSSHPLSNAIVQHMTSVDTIDISSYTEYPGKGFQANIGGHALRVGSSRYIFFDEETEHQQGVFIEIDGTYCGYYKTKHHYRQGVHEVISQLQQKYTLSVLSGDNASEYERIATLFGHKGSYIFDQSPTEKLQYIKQLQSKGQRVMMIGDGLNDAGALKQSDVGIVITDDSNNFTPASDAILASESFHMLSRYLHYIDIARYIVYGAFGLAFLYNFIGLLFATTGNLSPIVAAILMPISSVSTIVYGISISYIVHRSIFKI